MPKKPAKTPDKPVPILTVHQLEQLLIGLEPINPARAQLPLSATMEHRAQHQMLIQSFYSITNALGSIAKGLKAQTIESTYENK